MAILVDFNQVCISALMAEMGYGEVDKFAEEHVPFLQHIVFNMLRSYRRKFKAKYGELIICTDNKSWRREVFPLYKAHRRTERDASDTNWTLIFETIYKFKTDLEANFPYRVFSIEGAEADDIIAILCEYYATNERDQTSIFNETAQDTLVLSGDKDFVQLKRHAHVDVYSPVLKKFITPEVDWQTSLKTHIIKGDKGDGVPNFRSPDNSFVDKIKQRPISSKNLEVWLTQEPDEFITTPDEARWYVRNWKCIDLTNIPASIQDAILNTYAKQEPGNRRNMLNYFVNQKMRNMIELVDEY